MGLERLSEDKVEKMNLSRVGRVRRILVGVNCQERYIKSEELSRDFIGGHPRQAAIGTASTKGPKGAQAFTLKFIRESQSPSRIPAGSTGLFSPEYYYITAIFEAQYYRNAT